MTYKRGTNQFRRKPKVTVNGYIGAWCVLATLTLTTLHYTAIGASLGYKAGEAWAKDTFILTVEAPTKLISPLANSQVYAEEKPVFTDVRVEKVYTFLQSKHSPLAQYADLIVSEADKNDIPWTLVPAISGKESSFGVAIKPGSHNGWGIMAWDKAGTRFIRSFSSWEEAIKFESELLARDYRANMYRGIQAKYCPDFECSNTWVANVTGFSEEINK
jgi:hypothetical protein